MQMHTADGLSIFLIYLPLIILFFIEFIFRPSIERKSSDPLSARDLPKRCKGHSGDLTPLIKCPNLSTLKKRYRLLL